MDIQNLFDDYQQGLRRNADRAFGWLMLLQWALFAVAAAVYSSATWLSILALGTLVAAPTLYIGLLAPGQYSSARYIIALAQMSFSALLVYFFSDHMEAPLHIFLSLAFITVYRDWRLLISATLFFILAQLVLSNVLPLMGFPPPETIPWHWAEQTAWLLFANIFLIYTCRRAIKEMWRNAAIQAELMKMRIDSEQIHIKRMHFFSVVSHELRTPLNGIIGYSDFLANASLPPEQKEYATIIKQCSDTLLKLINDLLDFSKIDSGRFEIEPHQFKVQEICQHIQNVFALECQKKNLSLCFNISEEIPQELVGDSHRIRQVLTNIVGNAVKFTPAGQIQISLCRSPDKDSRFLWSVQDTGIGIKKEYLSSIFSPYSQEHPSTSRNYGGTGLGLATSKKLVELMGGQLKVESRYGQGTKFIFSIPLKIP